MACCSVLVVSGTAKVHRIGVSKSRGVQVRAIRRNLLCDTDTGSLRNLGVTGEDDEDDDEGRGAKVVKPVVEHMNHLFRPHRDEPGYVLFARCWEVRQQWRSSTLCAHVDLAHLVATTRLVAGPARVRRS